MSAHRIRQAPAAIAETARTFLPCPNCECTVVVMLRDEKAVCPRCSNAWNWKHPRSLRMRRSA